MAFRQTVIGSELSAWTCQPYCCQRAVTLIPSGPQHSAEIFQIAPENKKPGVERRAKPPPEWLCAKLDIFLACARNEPHYRIYFWPSLDLMLGRTYLRPDCDAPESLVYPQAVCKYTHFPGFVKPLTQKILGTFCVNP